jgi:hypothetical protein
MNVGHIASWPSYASIPTNEERKSYFKLEIKTNLINRYSDYWFLERTHTHDNQQRLTITANHHAKFFTVRVQQLLNLLKSSFPLSYHWYQQAASTNRHRTKIWNYFLSVSLDIFNPFRNF